jgi:DNA-damage-inducible protein D
MDQGKALVVFQDKKIRRVWHNEEWWFSVADIIDALIDSEDARTYWKVLSTGC